MSRLVLACMLAIALGGTAAHAEDLPDYSIAPPTGGTLIGTFQLSMEDAIGMALKNNLEVEIARHSPLVSWQEVQAAFGAYDPELFGDYGWQSVETPIASSLQASAQLVQRDLSGSAGMRGKVPWLNATYEMKYEGNRNTSNSTIQLLSPQNTASVTFSASVPLLRNLIWDQDWTRVKQSRIVNFQTLEDFRRQVMDTVRDTETAYWTLVAEEEQQRVAEKSVETAQELLRQTKTQYEVGVVSRVEVTQAEAGLAEREFILIGATNRRKTAQDALLDLALGRELRPGTTLVVDPTDRPQDYIVYEIDVEEAASKAFENRPELASARQEIERRAIEAKFRNNQRLPQLDVEGSYGYQGLSGGVNEDAINLATGGPVTGPLPGIRRNYRGTDDKFFEESGSSVASIRGVFSIPLFNKRARANASVAQIELRRSKVQLARLEQRIILDVRLAARNLESAQEGIEAAERARVAAAEQLRAERIRLEQGESTPFDVLLREEDLVESESALIDAIRVYRNSIVALDREQGTILKSRNVLIDDVRTLR